MARRYGPSGSGAEDIAIAAEVDELVQRLGGSLRGWRGGIVPIALLMAIFAGTLPGQAPAPEGLYEAGALRAAAEGFSRRAELEPAVAAHWYNLGAAYYRLGAKGRASAAWIRARRLAPREATVLRALRLTPTPDATSARMVWSPPVTAQELLLLGALAWLVGWAGWVWRPRAQDRWTIVLAFGAIAALSAVALHFWYQRPIAMVLDQTTLRVSPHGRAPAVGPVEAGAAVRMLRSDRGWVLVRAGPAEGWVASEAIATIGG
jgi:tetratricopeptide (TPR) repeat protein